MRGRTGAGRGRPTRVTPLAAPRQARTAPAPPPPRPAPAEKPPLQVHGRNRNFVFPPHKDGVAVYEYPNSYFTYTGDWKGGVKEGKGRFQIGPNSYYVGDFAAGEISGVGQRVFSNGNTYEGEFQDGEFNGHGKFIDAVTGEEYDGDWKDNRRHGEGVLKFPDGTVFRGHFENHKRNGHGQYTSTDGNSYDGEWQDNRIQGKGTMTYANGDVYSGDFVDGKRHGQGTIQWAESHLIFTGEWTDDANTYAPNHLELSDLPAVTPGTSLSNMTISVKGGAGETGRRLKVMVEIGRFDPTAQKKTAKPKKAEQVEHEPKFMVLNSETGATALELVVENGRVVVPPIPVPLDAEHTLYTVMVSDLSEVNPLANIQSDLQWVSPGASVAGEKVPPPAKVSTRTRGGRGGSPASRSSERKSVKGK